MRTCQTPGATYITELRDDSVQIRVELPNHIKIESENAAKEIENQLHDAVEAVLGRLFQS